MKQSLTAEDSADVERSVLIGTRRRPVAIPKGLESVLEPIPSDRRALAVLALTAQRRRLTARPTINPAKVEAGAQPHDPRPVMPEMARASFRKFLAAAAGASDLHFSHALTAVLKLAGLRLHPYDLPQAHKLGGAFDAVCGPFEHWWISRNRTKPIVEIPDLATESDWKALKPAALRAALAAWREKDCAAARAFFESVFASGSAEQRAALVEGLATGLCLDDAALLERAASDKSVKVRAAAEQVSTLAAGLPGYAKLLEQAAGCFTIKRKNALSLGAAKFKDFNWRSKARLRFSDLAAALGLSAEEFADAAKPDHVPCLSMLLSYAVHEGRADIHRRLLSRAGADARACLGASDPMTTASPAARRAVVAPLFNPKIYVEPPASPSEAALALAAWLGGPLDPATVRKAASAPGFLKSRALFAERLDCAEGWAPRAELVGLAALSPPQAAGAVIAALEPVSEQASLRPAFAYLRWLDDLAKAGITLPEDA